MTDQYGFTNLKYDDCNYQQKIGENIQHYNYLTDASSYSYTSCWDSEPGKIQDVSRYGPPANVFDVENELRGQNYKNSKCDKDMFNPMENCPNCAGDTGLPCNPECRQQYPLRICERDNWLNSTNTRYDKGKDRYAEKDYNRFEFPDEDYEKLAHINSYNFQGRSTRLEIRDAFEKKNDALENLRKQRNNPTDPLPFLMYGCEQNLPADLGLDCKWDPKTQLKNVI